MVDPSRSPSSAIAFGGTVAQELSHTGAPVVGTVVVHGSFRDFTPGLREHQGPRPHPARAEDPTAPLSELDLAIKELRQTQVDGKLELLQRRRSRLHHAEALTGPTRHRANVRAWAATQKILRRSLQELLDAQGAALLMDACAHGLQRAGSKRDTQSGEISERCGS